MSKKKNSGFQLPGDEELRERLTMIKIDFLPEGKTGSGYIKKFELNSDEYRALEMGISVEQAKNCMKSEKSFIEVSKILSTLEGDDACIPGSISKFVHFLVDAQAEKMKLSQSNASYDKQDYQVAQARAKVAEAELLEKATKFFEEKTGRGGKAQANELIRQIKKDAIDMINKEFCIKEVGG